MSTPKRDHSRPWAKNRADMDASAAIHLRGAENHLKAAMSSASCRDVPKMLAEAAMRIGQAEEASRLAVPGARGRKSRQLGTAISKVEKQIRTAMSGYASGPCVVSTLSGLGRARRAPKRRRK